MHHTVHCILGTVVPFHSYVYLCASVCVASASVSVSVRVSVSLCLSLCLSLCAFLCLGVCVCVCVMRETPTSCITIIWQPVAIHLYSNVS